MILLIIPLGKLALGGISEKYLPPTNSVRLAQEEFDKTFPGFRTEPITLVIKNNDGQPVTDQQVADIRNKAMGINGFTDPDNNPDAMWKERPYLDGASKDPSVRVIQNGLVVRNDAAKKINELRGIVPPKGLSLYVGGTPALEQDSIHSLFSRLPLMVLLLITTTTVLMFLAFGSLVLPIKAALMSALTLGSTMGVLTWMFVEGHGSGLMNYTPQPLMAPMIGLIIAVIYGLSTDYEVFLVSRMVEAREQGMSTTEAIRIGTATTGRLITAAALVLAVVAGAFVFSDLVMMKYLAFGLLIALLLDATIVRMFLVPAIMKLLGDDCWWAPKWMKRLQHKIGLGETTLPDERVRPALPAPAPEPATAGAVTVPAPSPLSAPRQPLATAVTAPVSSPVNAPAGEEPTTRFASAKPRDERDIGSWLGELRRKTSREPAEADPSAQQTNIIHAPPTEDATMVIRVQSADAAEQTRAIPVSRPETVDTEVATEQLNARGKTSGGVSAADLLRREGRL
jgi:RND superfamily putative drug exporter